MHCPFCGHEETKVNDSRLAGEGRQIRRRRECLKCGERFTTFETAELIMPLVIKGDRGRESFDEGKLRSGMEKALEKRPVPREQIDEAVSRIVHRVRSLGDVEAFHEEIERLRSARAQAPPQLQPARGGRHKRAGPGAANRDQLPLLPPEPAANDAGPGADGKK